MRAKGINERSAHISGQRSAIVQLAQMADDPSFLFCAGQVLGDPH